MCLDRRNRVKRLLLTVGLKGRGYKFKVTDNRARGPVRNFFFKCKFKIWVSKGIEI